MSRSVDVAIIGSGTAGMTAFSAVKKSGKSLVMIENAAYGTTCARVGCMPSKLLIAAAESVHQLQKAPAFGIHLQQGFSINGREVMQRVRQERDRFVGFVVDNIERMAPEEKIHGHARFVSPNRIEMDNGEQIEARSIILATGSSPFIPPQLREAGDRLIINDDLFDWQDLPESVAVFGPGVIGLELGQALSRLGVRVRIFGRGKGLGSLRDPEILDYATQLLSEELNLSLDSEMTHIRRTEQGVAITYTDASGVSHEETFAYLLAATGRRPNLEQLNLQAAGLQLNERGQPVFDPHTGQCLDNNGQPSSVFIAGDAANYRPLMHEASDEGYIAGKNAAHWPDVQSLPRRTPLAIVFTEPQMAQAGLTFPDLQSRIEQGEVIIGKASFENQGRARVLLINKGMMKVYADKKSGQLLGTEIFGPQAEHLAHLLAWSIQQQLTLPQILQMPFYHPVVEEGMKTALQAAAKQLDHKK